LTDATFDQLVSARSGDEEARERLLANLRPRLVLWASSRMSPKLASRISEEDVAQEILLALHESLPQFRGGDAATLRAWVFTIAENRLRDLARSANALKRRTVPMQRSQTSPSGAAMRAEARASVHEALPRLKEEYRTVIRLRRIEDLDTAETAERMMRTPGAVRVLYLRAIRALRRELERESE
jgi:RNA polymerase sigma-70 factor (ECF subfamily)